MKLARYVGNGDIEIRDEPEPEPQPGGLIVQTLASGLCSGELMSWYMDQKIPHVLGHEVSGEVVWSDDERFPVGCRVAPHHHAPCLNCEWCRSGRFVHCAQWKSTKLVPGGMAEKFYVSAENLNDCYRVDHVWAEDAALLEPLGCVMKSVSRALSLPGTSHETTRGQALHLGDVAVIGLGVMGLLHALALGDSAVGYDTSPLRRDWAVKQGIKVGDVGAPDAADTVIVCPGTPAAFEAGIRAAKPGGTVLMFSPFGPGESPTVDWDRIYFKELRVVPSYSCGPGDTAAALELLAAGKVKAKQVVSDFISLNQLPDAYRAMKAGEIVKAMVLF